MISSGVQRKWNGRNSFGIPTSCTAVTRFASSRFSTVRAMALSAITLISPSMMARKASNGDS
jgi:hypothetical protein